ncbi:MAG: hypothetical protein ABI442_05620 [Gemmatimonadaceae bacterium]
MRRTEIQIALLVIGMIAWGSGSRVDNDLLKYVGIGCFAAATMLRLFKRRAESSEDEASSSP